MVWTRQHGFQTPFEAIRSMKILPALLGEPSMSHFGAEDGRPMIISSDHDLIRSLMKG